MSNLANTRRGGEAAVRPPSGPAFHRTSAMARAVPWCGITKCAGTNPNQGLISWNDKVARIRSLNLIKPQLPSPFWARISTCPDFRIERILLVLDGTLYLSIRNVRPRAYRRRNSVEPTVAAFPKRGQTAQSQRRQFGLGPKQFGSVLEREKERTLGRASTNSVSRSSSPRQMQWPNYRGPKH
jgi:hypothetical protein